MTDYNGWNEWKNLVLRDLGVLRNEVTEIRTSDLPDIKAEIASLKAKAAVYGAFTGTIFSGLAYIVFNLIAS